MENLDLQQIEVLVYVVLGLVVVTLIGLMIYVVGSLRRHESEATAALLDVEDLVVRPSMLVVGQVLALIRDEPGGPIQVEIEGTKYPSLAGIEDPKIRRQVVDAALELIQFTGVLGDEKLELSPLDKTETWREDLREGSQMELDRARGAATERTAPSQPPAPEEVEEQFLNLLSEMGQSSPPLEKPTLVRSIQHSLKPKPLETGAPYSFVDDIEDIVQRRVRMVPALIGRGLHVRLGPAKKVLFTFEGQDYQNVDDIPNLTARQVIRDAIQEWDELT